MLGRPSVLGLLVPLANDEGNVRVAAGGLEEPVAVGTLEVTVGI